MTDIVERLRDTPNWQRQSFEHWKTATSVYDRAPFEAADEIERLRAERDALREALVKIAAQGSGAVVSASMADCMAAWALAAIRNSDSATAAQTPDSSAPA